MDNKKCAQCGKPFPEGQLWCNWCDKESGASRDSAVEVAVEHPPGALESKLPVEVAQPASFIGTLSFWLFKGVVIAIGLLFVLGGGLLGLCGMAGHGSDGILLLIAIMPIALGGYFIVLAFSGKSDVRYEPLDDISQQKTNEADTDNKTEVK